MTHAKVMVVEDEAIISMDLQNRLRKLGYAVAGTAARGEDVLPRARACGPDLVLMDIMLGGEMDGIEAASRVRGELDLPVIFVTAHSDEATLRRAKITEPYGYVLKPFEDREIVTSVEIALYRHRADRKLRGMERWLAMTLKSIGDGVIATDLDGKVTFLNGEAERLTGWPALDALGQPFTEVFHAVHTRTEAPIENPVARVLREGLAIGLPADTTLIGRTGTRVDVEDCAAPMRDENGRVTGAVLVFRDASKQRQVEEKLRQAEEWQEQMRKLESLGSLTGGVAHDFNNLMTIVMGYSDMLLKMRDDVDDESRQKGLQSIRNAAERAAALTRQLLTFGRRHTIKPEALNLCEQTGKLLDALRRLIGEHIEIVTHFPAEPAKTMIDPVQLDQILINLAANARDAMPNGGTLTIETCVRAVPDEGEYAVLSVRDTGTGIDDATRARIFEPFFTTKKVGTGTGIGLSTVHAIVSHYGGRIEVDTLPGQGSCFRVLLPRHTENAQAKAAPAEGAITGGRETILVVEDDAAVRTLVCEVLGTLGYSTLEAEGPARAIELLRQHQPHVAMVISDLIMPGMNGVDLLNELRSIQPNLGALFMSGYLENPLHHRLLSSVRTDFIAKPFTPRALALSLRGVLDMPQQAS
ncbi:MAG: hypothetical protein AMXMBFR7_34760 [Planctomycetota bacterium]